jgi:hypothetical protein
LEFIALRGITACCSVTSGKLTITNERKGLFEYFFFREYPAGSYRTKTTELIARAKITGAIPSATKL